MTHEQAKTVADLMNRKQLQEILKISTPTIVAMEKRGELKPRCIGSKKFYKWTEVKAQFEL